MAVANWLAMSGNRRHFLGTLAAGAAMGAPAMAAYHGEALAAATRVRGRGAAAVGGLYDITHLGAQGDGRTLCTSALQAAMDAAAAAGGGTVLVPPGTFRTGAVFLRSNIHLHLSAGATLLGSTRFDDFPPVEGRWEGVEREVHASLLTGRDLENVAITGNGILAGQRKSWWPDPAAPLSPRGLPRPHVINLVGCQGVVLSGVMVHDSPSYNINLVYCQDAIIDGVTILSMSKQALNNDGIVLDSCRQVRIANCSVSTGCDNIALRAGKRGDGAPRPCEEVVITNCHLALSSWAAIALGRDTAGGIRNVAISNCVIADCKYGIRIKTARGRGGGIEQIRASNLVMQRVARGIECSAFFDLKEADNPSRPAADEGTPTLRELSFSGLTLTDVGEVARIEGLPERFVRGVRIQDVSASQVRLGIVARRTADLRVSGLALDPPQDFAVLAREVSRLEVHRLSCPRQDGRSPLIQLEHVSRAFVHGCDVDVSGTSFVRLEGDRNSGVTITANNTAERDLKADLELRSRFD
jgi:hypothetical protein